MPSVYSLFAEKWKDCQQCHLKLTRSRVVLARGKVPCDVLFTGEGPGHSEDALGQPFVGPAGHLLDQIVAQSVPDTVRVGFCNLVCCIPLDEDGEKAVEPFAEEISACSDRLREFVKMCAPRMLVSVGQLPKRWLPKLVPDYKGKTCDIMHPSAMLRQPSLQQSFAVRRAVVVLSTAVREMLDA